MALAAILNWKLHFFPVFCVNVILYEICPEYTVCVLETVISTLLVMCYRDTSQMNLNPFIEFSLVVLAKLQ
jgi:hypothetical protein